MIVSNLRNKTLAWLMKYNRNFVYYLAKYGFKNKTKNVFLPYAVEYHDLQLLEIAIKKSENINKKTDEKSLLYKAINSKFNEIKLGVQEKAIPLKTYEKNIYNLNYNKEFIQNLFDYGFLIEEELEEKIKLLNLITNKLSDTSSLIKWEHNFEHNLLETKQLLDILNKNSFKITNIEIISKLHNIVSNFKNIRQWTIFTHWLNNELLLSTDQYGNNFLHYYIDYLNQLSEQLIQSYKEQYDFSINNRGQIPFITFLDAHGYSSNLGKNNIFVSASAINIASHIVMMGSTELGKSMYNPVKKLVCPTLYDFVWDFWKDMDKYPGYNIAINQKNNLGLTPLQLCEEELTLFLRNNVNYNKLNAELSIKNKDNPLKKVQKI